VQLAAADQHRADLGELAALAREAVGLRVDGEELGLGERGVEQARAGRGEERGHGRTVVRPGADGVHARVQARKRRARAPDGGTVAPVRHRRLLLLLAAATTVAGCGSTHTYANKDRPPSPVTISGSIDSSQVRITPARSAPARS
jgi:hypothetical protein